MPRQYALILAIISLAGCADSTGPARPLPPALASTSTARSAVQSHAWKGRCEGTSIFTSATTVLITGTCQFAHVGRMNLVATETLDGFGLSATNTYTAPNGDVLNTTSRGSFTLRPDGTGLTFTGVETAVGGTGRFRDAVGTATRSGTIIFGNPNIGSYELSGTLTLSHKRESADETERVGNGSAGTT